MKRAFVLLSALVLIAGCGSSDTSPAASDDNRAQFTANLTATNEVPPIPNATEAAATGTAHIDFHLTKDAAGTITAATVDFRVDLANFPAGSAITLAHIHTGAAGVSGGVLVNTTVAAGEVTLTNGTGTFSRINLTTLSAANAQAIINNPAGFYFNVHSALNPAGVIRGQL
ncbi:MAG TPA: CHRD domain-containing protein, partial [Planctomycetaceae bacterium]|nr:CHRD domain-containing protein [Planctomycetaceae bacterium]